MLCEITASSPNIQASGVIFAKLYRQSEANYACLIGMVSQGFGSWRCCFISREVEGSVLIFWEKLCKGFKNLANLRVIGRVII